MAENSEKKNSEPNSHVKLNCDIFSGCVIYLCKANISKTRFSLLESKVKSNGGLMCDSPDSNSLTCVVLDDTLCKDENSCLSILKRSGLTMEKLINIKVLKVDWICECLKQKQKINSEFFEIRLRFHQKVAEESPDERNLFGSANHNVYSSVNDDLVPPKSKRIKEDSIDDSKYLCSHISCNETGTQKNYLIINELQKLADAFRSQGDQWRSHSYEKAIRAIKNYNKEIHSYNEAKQIPGIGDRIALKVKELLEEGHIRKVDEICGDEKNEIFKLFSGVWGAGPATVQAWYRKGYKTLEDLETKATLTKQQKIGLKYYNDIQEKMPRSEVEEIAELVKQKALEINNRLQIVTCGSYRRGKKMCGDVDIVIIKPDSLASYNILFLLYKELKKIDFISDDLTTIEFNGNDKKYLGMCHLPGENQRHRRLDIFVVPESESACAIMHYTGSALFNRSIRLLAMRKGMCLSEHALTTDAVRTGIEVKNTGAVLPTPTEESIFSLLGLEYRPPEQRDH